MLNLPAQPRDPVWSYTRAQTDAALAEIQARFDAGNKPAITDATPASVAAAHRLSEALADKNFTGRVLRAEVVYWRVRRASAVTNNLVGELGNAVVVLRALGTGGS